MDKRTDAGVSGEQLATTIINARVAEGSAFSGGEGVGAARAYRAEETVSVEQNNGLVSFMDAVDKCFGMHKAELIRCPIAKVTGAPEDFPFGDGEKCRTCWCIEMLMPGKEGRQKLFVMLPSGGSHSAMWWQVWRGATYSLAQKAEGASLVRLGLAAFMWVPERGSYIWRPDAREAEDGNVLCWWTAEDFAAVESMGGYEVEVLGA